MADPRIYLSTQPLLPVSNPSSASSATSQKKSATSFADALTKAEKKVSFSQHALERMQSRNLDLSDQDLDKLDDTVEKMAQTPSSAPRGEIHYFLTDAGLRDIVLA